MTDQPFLPNTPRRDAEESESDSGALGPIPVVERENEDRFEVCSFTSHVQPGLYVTEEFFDYGLPPWQVACQGVAFSASARILLDEEGWELGWIQTVRPCRFWVVYGPPGDEGAPARLVTSLEQAKRDGNSGVIWFEDSHPLTRNEWVKAEMSDDPNIGFWHPAHTGDRYPQLLGWTPRSCGGTKEFWSWLVAYKEEGHELVFLHHVHWEVRFGGDLTPGPGVEAEAGSGAFIIEEGPGKGAGTPCYDGQEIEVPGDETSTLEQL